MSIVTGPFENLREFKTQGHIQGGVLVTEEQFNRATSVLSLKYLVNRHLGQSSQEDLFALENTT